MTTATEEEERQRRRITPPTDTRAFHAEVARVVDISPHFRRITVRSDAIADFEVRGADQWFRTFLPTEGTTKPTLPVTEKWWPETQAMDAGVRPIIRNYTVRDVRPEVRELDIDIVVHGDAGPGSKWACNAVPGDWIGILDQGVIYAAQDGDDWQLIVGDETALPAVVRIIEGLAVDATARVFVELASLDDAQPLPDRPDVEVVWLPRPEETKPGEVVLNAVRNADLPGGAAYAWVSGESDLVKYVRRHLVNDRGMSKDAISFCGYWRYGASYYS